MSCLFAFLNIEWITMGVFSAQECDVNMHCTLLDDTVKNAENADFRAKFVFLDLALKFAFWNC